MEGNKNYSYWKKKKKGETEGAERLENVTWRCCKAGQLPKGKRLSVKW